MRPESPGIASSLAGVRAVTDKRTAETPSGGPPVASDVAATATPSIRFPEMDAKSPSQSSAVLAHWMGVSDANSLGAIHGGTVMKLVDEAAAHRGTAPRTPPSGDGRRRPDDVPGPDRRRRAGDLQRDRQRRLADVDGGRGSRRGGESAHRRGSPHQHRLRDDGRARRRRPTGGGTRARARNRRRAAPDARGRAAPRQPTGRTGGDRACPGRASSSRRPRSVN